MSNEVPIGSSWYDPIVLDKDANNDVIIDFTDVPVPAGETLTKHVVQVTMVDDNVIGLSITLNAGTVEEHSVTDLIFLGLTVEEAVARREELLHGTESSDDTA